MDSVKNVLALVGIASIIVVAGLASWFCLSSDSPDDGSDAASSSDIVADLNRYAETLNDPSLTARICVNNTIFLVSGTSPSSTAEPIKGTVKVVGLSLELDKKYNEVTIHHYIIPYHAISGVRITSSTNRWC